MNYIKLVTILILCFLISPILSTPTTASNDRATPVFDILDFFLSYFNSFIHPFFQFVTETAAAKPEKIEIGYNEKVTIDVGLVSLAEDDTYGEFLEVDFIPFILTSRYVTFEAEFPTGNPGNMWFVNFDPPILYYELGKTMKAKATISLNAPPDPLTPVQSGVIRINVTDTWVYGNLWWSSNPDATLGFQFMWFIGAVLPGGYGRYSGSVENTYFNVDILVTVKPYHAVTLEALPPEKLAPNDIVSIPLIVQNLGNYNDTIQFSIESRHENIRLIDPATISLEPGQQGMTYVSVAVPPSVLDTGTLHTIKIKAYSLDEPEEAIAEQSVFLETQGIYFSEISFVYFLIFVFIIGVILFFTLYRRYSALNSLCKKPEKPWSIPEEKKYLEDLQKQDKKQYDDTLILMTQEYHSALLWYKDYKTHLLLTERQDKILPRIYSSFSHKIRSLAKKPDEKKVRPVTVQSEEQREHKKLSFSWLKKTEPKKQKETTLSSPDKEQKNIFESLLRKKNGLDQIDKKPPQPTSDTESGLFRELSEKKKPLPFKEPTVKEKTDKIDLERDRALKKIKRAQEKQRARKLNM